MSDKKIVIKSKPKLEDTITVSFRLKRSVNKKLVDLVRRTKSHKSTILNSVVTSGLDNIEVK